MYKLYGMMSPNVTKVVVMLEELGSSFDFEHVYITEGDQFKREFLDLNPNNKVPVLIDDDGPDGGIVTTWESGAILLYLSEKSGKFMPAQLEQRASVFQWLMLQIAYLGPMQGQYQHFVRGATEDIPYARDRYYSEVVRIFGAMDTGLSESEYFGSNDYSIADIAYVGWVHAIRGYHEMGLDYGLDFERFKHIKRWFGTVMQRPAVERAVEFMAGVMARDREKIAGANPDYMDLVMGRGRWANLTPTERSELLEKDPPV